MRPRPNQQEDVEDIILDVLENGLVQTTAEITKAVKSRSQLTAADLMRANRRPNEARVDQIIANAMQATRRLCRDGLIERTARGEFRITEAGRAYRTKFKADVASMSETLTSILGSNALD